MNYKKITIAFSEKEHDLPVLQTGLDIAARYGAELNVLHINTHHAGYPSRAMRKIEHKYSKEELYQIIDENNQAGLKPEVELVESDDIIAEIVARSSNCDLLVLGHQHMGFFESIISDSTDEKIIDKIDCHALVVKRS